MQVTVAKSAGFCFGVQRAVDTVYEQVEKGVRPIYTSGPIIHNEVVVQDLEEKGVQVLESQGLIVRLATKRIYTVELDEEQIELIFEMIGEILKKAVQHVLNTKSQTEEKEVFSTETRPDQLLLAQMENGYLTNLLKNASECYIRFATKCKETDGKKETEKAICEKIAGALNGAEKYTKTFAKAVNSEIDRWVLLLAEQVKEERRKNR